MDIKGLFNKLIENRKKFLLILFLSALIIRIGFFIVFGNFHDPATGKALRIKRFALVKLDVIPIEPVETVLATDPDKPVAILHNRVSDRHREPLLDAQIGDADGDGAVGKGLGEFLLAKLLRDKGGDE